MPHNLTKARALDALFKRRADRTAVLRSYADNKEALFKTLIRSNRTDAADELASHLDRVEQAINQSDRLIKNMFNLSMALRQRHYTRNKPKP